MAKERKITYNDNDRAIVNALKGAENGLTLAEINEATGLNLVSGNIVSTMGKGLIEAIGEREYTKMGKSKVSTYHYVNSNARVNAKGEQLDFTEKQDAVLKAAQGYDGYFTLADLAAAMGVEKVAPGVVTPLVKAGNLEKGEDREVLRPTKGVHKVYGFVKDIPADAE